MPCYVKATAESIGELFKNCGTKKIAGRNSNEIDGAGSDYSLVSDFNWSASANSASSVECVSFYFSVTVPYYEPLIAMSLNAINQKVSVEKMEINEVNKNPTGGSQKVEGKYVAENGAITNISASKHSSARGDSSKKDCSIGTVTISFEFEKVYYDDNKTQVSGSLTTINAG